MNQLGMGLGGPLGGFIADRYARLCSIPSNVILKVHRLGWRWAFIIQLPMFAVSFVLTSINLRYVTPVRLVQPPCSTRFHMLSS